jgi:hypothetical protein
MTAGIVGWPRFYIIDMCKVYLSQQGVRQHSDSNLREDGVYSGFLQDIYSQLGDRLERQMNMTFLLIGELRPKAVVTVSVNSVERRGHA